jgi:hypothetical protein
VKLLVLTAVVVAVGDSRIAASQTPSYVITGDAKIGRFQTWEDGKLAVGLSRR